MSSTEFDTTSINNNNDEEAHIISKYADELDNISIEFVDKLPPNDKAVLIKLLDQQQQIHPLEQPFTLVQPKLKGKPSNNNTISIITSKHASMKHRQHHQQ
jgi:Mg/Co/Ni transporter MgtE